MSLLQRHIFLLFFLLLSSKLVAQFTLSGTISDVDKVGIPYAQLFVKNSPELRTNTNDEGVYSLQLFPGEYYLVIRSTGYEEREVYVTITNGNVIRDIQLLEEKFTDLDEVAIVAKKSNKGREYMLEVVKKRDTINPWNYPHTTNVYIKATEELTKAPPKKTPENEDVFDEEKKKLEALAGSMNLAEVQITRSFNPPNQVKEERTGFEVYGKTDNLYYTTTVKSNFNFFENLLHLPDLHESPVSSPISGPGILSYKYRLEAQYMENGYKIHKIKISPRASSTSTLTGYVWVIDSLWLVQKLELTMEKGNLKVYDNFTIIQTFDHPGDSMCVLKEQTLIYGVKYKNETSKCKTIAKFSDYDFQPAFAKKYFNNELALTTKEAYERDSSFWNQSRKVELTPQEQRFIIVRDSINDALNRKEYLDSVDAVFNKITPWKVLWFGVDHRNRAKRTQWNFNSIAAMARPLYPAGPRVAPGFSYFKKWENQKSLESYTEMSVGVLNGDVKGSTWCRYLYDPFHQGKVRLNFSNEFDAIVPFDAITQVYKRSNFIEVTRLRGIHSYEYFNGFYVDAELEFSERRSLAKYNTIGAFDSLIPNDQFTEFQGYQALLADITISYTPAQKYMREPYRKVVLGSKWPTFYAYYQRGIPKLFGSDIDHEYGILGMYQSLQIGTLGTTNYHLRGGKFLSSKNLKPADFKYQRRSTPLWFSNPLYGYQIQDSSLPSTDYYLEAHFVHHDNGAIINKIPFMKKTKIGLVFGTSLLYVSEYNYQYGEIFAGLERNFKFSKRRLRIGLYGVACDGNKIDPRFAGKISFAVLDDRNMKYNF